MKRFIFHTLLTLTSCSMDTNAQTTAEKEILDLSHEKFRWKTTDKIDLVADLFNDELIFVNMASRRFWWEKPSSP